MKGSIRARGQQSWQLRYYAGRDPATQQHVYRSQTFKGSKKEAQTELTRLLAAVADDRAVAPSKLTIAEFLDKWDRDWAAVNLAPKTLQRYRELLRHNIRPHFGRRALQEVRPLEFQEHYSRLMRESRTFTHLRKGKEVTRTRKPLGARTVGHVHRVLRRALGHAVAWQMLSFNPVAGLKPPRVEDQELEIVKADQLPDMLGKLRDRELYPLAVTALASGCRRGELLALHWRECDLGDMAKPPVGGKLKIIRSLEETSDGIREKAPKSKNGRRTITIDAYAVGVLRAHRKRLLEQRIALGQGALTGDDLVFPAPAGGLESPDRISRQWTRTVAALKLPPVSLHGLRHTHASICIAKGMNVLTISRRMGHATAAFTLKVYGHLFDAADDRGAAIMGAVFAEAAPPLAASL